VPIYCYFVFAKQLKQKAILNNRLEKFELIIDSEEEFGNMYGTKIVSGSLNDMLTKSLFLISKDGAIFYLELPEELEKPLNLERLQVELNKAYVSYTGTGCH
jgi:peroxiredoxin